MDTKTISTQFELQTRLFNNVLQDVDDQELDHRASEHVNHLHWLATHLLAIRMGLRSFGGLSEDNSMQHFLGKSISDIQEYPPLSEIKEKWNGISSDILKGLQHMNAEQLEGEAPVQVPVSDRTLGGYLGFLMHHEAYHLGQMGILRKYMGQPAMAYT